MQPPGPAQSPAGPIAPGRRPPPDPALVSRAVRAFAVALLGTMLASMLPLPWSLGGLPLALVTVVTGIRAIVLSVRARRRGLTVPLIAAGLAFTLMLAVGLVGAVILWPLQQERQTCLSRALTISARETCERQFTEGVQQWQRDLLDRVG